MFFTNIKRVIKAGFISFWRNGFVSLSSILIMTVTLSVIGSVLFLLATLDASLRDLKSKVDVNVYLSTSALEADILALQKSLKIMPEVKSVEYVTREQALVNFKKRHENDAPTLDALAELSENPLSAVLNIVAKEPGQYETVANFLRSDNALSADKQAIISKINYDDNKTAITVLSKIINSAKKFGLAATVALIIISIIITFNTIRLVIYTSRDEISVMKLVGASNKYIRGPFVISGILYGLVASALTLGTFYPLTYYLGTSTANFFNGINVFHYYVVNFAQIFVIIIGCGIVLGSVSSYLAVRRYLRM
ncbi:MAG: ABC transporter permease [Candidatus Taylorbacteria bacterium]|nr:ABC transporter permease [Candidatus Taylorbacteria bacterium]